MKDIIKQEDVNCMRDMKFIMAAIISVFVLVGIASAYTMPGNIAGANSNGGECGTGDCTGDCDSCGDSCTDGACTDCTDGGCTDCTGEDAISIQCDEGNQGSVDVPYVGINFVDTDTKHHWDMTGEELVVIAVLNWDDQSFNLQFDIGTGECPHSGETKVADSGSSGQLMLRYDDELGLDEMQWFAHVKCLNPEENRGSSCCYTMQIVLFDCPDCADAFVPIEGCGGCGGCGD